MHVSDISEGNTSTTWSKKHVKRAIQPGEHDGETQSITTDKAASKKDGFKGMSTPYTHRRPRKGDNQTLNGVDFLY